MTALGGEVKKKAINFGEYPDNDNKVSRPPLSKDAPLRLAGYFYSFTILLGETKSEEDSEARVELKHCRDSQEES